MKYTFVFSFILMVHLSFGQFSISGVIKNENNEKLDGAVVFLKDTDHSTVTDARGNFSLSDVPQGDYELVATYLGYENHIQLITVQQNEVIDIMISGKLYGLDEIEVISNRIKKDNPFTSSIITDEQIEQNNLGQDIPFLINTTPSTVATSDAGAGIGYTGVRIRGVDQSRINVTVNGIPINDAESQGVFWVNMPDIARSLEEVQIQRGVGPSTNGPGAYGGGISMNTMGNRINPYLEMDGSLGSFNTKKLSVNLGTGLMNNKYSIDMRYSLIQSDGYLDRAASDLSSYYVSASKVTSNSSLRFITFSGKEKTYQAWYGTPQAKVNGDASGLLTHYNNNLGSIYKTKEDSINLFDSGRTYNYYTYDNQVDDYQQSHYQLHYAKQLNELFSYKSALFYTRGKGYFEEYKVDASLAEHGLNNYVIDSTEITESDLVRRRWLDNHLFGGLINVVYQLNENNVLTTGGLISRYIGDHYGNIDTVAGPVFYDPLSRYYDNVGKKTDANVFAKIESKLTNNLSAFGDLQYRYVHYDANGVDNDGLDIDVNERYSFFNPKLGLNYTYKNGRVYGSFAVANREPDRSDFLDNPKNGIPSAERLFDYELGVLYQLKKLRLGATFYYMDYKDQLIQTGDLNDVGSVLRTNVPDSYRTGVELEYAQYFTKWFTLSWNLTLSQNKIEKFTEVLFDYTNGFDRLEIEHEDVDIAFSPNIIYANQFSFNIVRGLTASVESKYVGKQYLDNTQSENRKLDAYLFNNLKINYTLPIKFARQIDLKLAVNNFLDAKYSANGYTYSYVFGDTITENFEYPQAGINFLFGLTLKF